VLLSDEYKSGEQKIIESDLFALLTAFKKITGRLENRLPEEIEGEEFAYAPILTYKPEDTTDFTINVDIEEGIVQDELALRKSAIELHQAGFWSRRRGMEETGVDDPAREGEEITQERLMDSEAMDQQVMVLAMARAAERFEASREQSSSPFMQELMKARQKLLGVGTPGLPGNQGGEPQNANPGGQPVQQNPPVKKPQQGGPAAGPSGPPLEQLGAAGIPGGVEGGNAPPAV